MLTGYDREKAERDAALKSYLELFDREHPNADSVLRSHVESAFAIGHMSAHQDVSNRNSFVTA